MLGDGIVSFGVAPPAIDRRNAKSSPKIVLLTPMRPSMCRAAGVNSITPIALRNSTVQRARRLADAVELVDEVHVPGGAPELAVGGGLEADVVLHRHDVADRVVLDRAQLVQVDPVMRVVLARLEQLRWSQQAADVVGSVGR